jgi:hypothetical protein
MSDPAKIDFKIYQGSTFRYPLRWESDKLIYKPITNISKTAPIAITSVGHGIPLSWRINISGVKGMEEVNKLGWQTAVVSNADLITINSVNATEFSTYTSGGLIQYYEPVNLAGLTARMQLRATINNSSVLHSMTTENGGIIVDNANKTIELFISSTATQNFTFTNAVYSLEVVLNGDTIPLLNGNIALEREVTR